MEEKIHIGKLIQSKMEEEGRKARWLANKIHCDESNIYRIYQRPFINIEQLIQICIHLEINLFVHYSDYVYDQIQKKYTKT